MIEFPLIYIEWCDAVETQKAWQSLEALKKWADTNDRLTLNRNDENSG